MEILEYIGGQQSPVYRVRIINIHELVYENAVDPTLLADLSKDYAVKVIRKDHGPTRENIILMKASPLGNPRLHHSGIIHCYGKFQAPLIIRKLVPDGWEILILDYIPGYPLFYLQENPDLSVNIVHQIMDELLTIIIYLHQRSIVHNDLHMQNILRKLDGHIVIIDFEYAEVTQDKIKMQRDLLSAIDIGLNLLKWSRLGDPNVLYIKLDLLRDIIRQGKFQYMLNVLKKPLAKL